MYAWRFPDVNESEMKDKAGIEHVKDKAIISSEEVKETKSDDISKDQQEGMDLPLPYRKENQKRTSKPQYPLPLFLSYKKLSPSYNFFLLSLDSVDIPKTFVFGKE